MSKRGSYKINLTASEAGMISGALKCAGEVYLSKIIKERFMKSLRESCGIKESQK